ncbi:MAG: SURF1 family protein [Pseudomonadales bacterium]
MTLFVVGMLPVLVGLGFWQLERAAEKHAYQARYFDRVGMLPRVPPQANGTDSAFLRVRLLGHYESGRHYLVDNRPRDGRPGYWVVSLFAGSDGRRYLVNRGWLAAPPSRDELPDVPTPTGAVTLVGVIWPDTGLTPLLAEDPWTRDWPRRVQRLDVQRMARQGEGAVAMEIRLEPGEPGVFAAVPVDAAFLPERHEGYAAQWFALAGVLVVGFVIFGLRRAPGRRSSQDR